jgi:hypothetical protein
MAAVQPDPWFRTLITTNNNTYQQDSKTSPSPNLSIIHLNQTATLTMETGLAAQNSEDTSLICMV